MKKISLLLAIVLFCSYFSTLTVSAYDELKNTDPEKYYILLDLNNQICTVFEKDDAGSYTKVARRFIVTTGRTKLDPEDPEDKGTPTPSGIWKIGGRERFGEFAEFRGTFARYWVQIVGSIFFHSIMFDRENPNTLQSSAYRSLGNNISHGCVRLYVEDAKWLYYNAAPGTTINVSDREKSNPELKKKLKYSMPFNEYKALQANYYDEPELPNPKAWVIFNNAQIRSGMGSTGKTIMKLNLNDEVEVLQIGDPWCKVTFGKKWGYVLTSQITFDKNVMSSTDGAYNMKDTNWMHEKPDAKSTRVVKVPQHTTVKVLEMKPDWTKAEYWGEVGYIQTKQLVKGWGLIR